MRDFLIYVENALPPESPYHVSEQAIISALGPLAAASDIKSCSATFPDYSALERADYFVGSGFDTGRLKAHGNSFVSSIAPAPGLKSTCRWTGFRTEPC